MKIYLKGTKVTQKVAAEYLQTVWKCDGKAMLNGRIVEAKNYVVMECGQPSSWNDGMMIDPSDTL